MRDVHKAKHAPPILVTEDGITNDSKELQSEKQPSPIVEIDDGNEISFIEEQALKVLVFNSEIVEGICIVSRDLHPSKQCSPIEVTEEGIDISFKFSQREKQLSPNVVTVEEIVNDVRLLQF